MEQPVTEPEVQKVIKHFKNGKIPEMGGFPAEFYKHFGEKYMFPMLGMFNDILNRWKYVILGILQK